MTAPRALVTGASQGIGLELVRQYAAAGWAVNACCRTPADASELQAVAARQPLVSIERLDITDHANIDELAQRLRNKAVDLLINNAGVLGALPYREHLSRQHFGSLDYELWDQVFRTNVLGTMKVTEAFVEHVAASRERKIVNLSSTTGSISESSRGAFAYTTSKTALNKAMTLLAERLRPRGIIVALICPGYVKTRMDVGGATGEIDTSVSAMRTLIAGLTLEDSGCFRRYNGETIRW